MTLSSTRRAFLFAAILVLTVFLVPSSRAAAAPAGTLLTPFYDFGQDDNGDGLYDYLVIDVTVDVTSPGLFAFRADLGQPQDVRAQLPVGVSHVHVAVYGWSLYNAGFDGPYDLMVELFDGNNLVRLDFVNYTTGAYTADEFQPPAAILSDPGIAYPLDTDSDGTADCLALNYTVNVTSTAEFYLRGEITGTSGYYVDSASWNEYPSLAVGIHRGTFQFPGWLLNATALDGPYQYDLAAVQNFTEYSFTVGYTVSFLSVTTAAYTHDQFDPPPLRLGAPLSDHGVDTDGDGLFEEIAVTVPLHLDVPATVSLWGLLGGGSLPMVMSNNQINRAVAAGDTSFDLLFPVFALTAAGDAGTFPVTIYVSAPSFPGLGLSDAYVTSFYDPSSLSPPSAALLVNKWTAPDTDADGKADFLEATINVTTQKEGDFFVQMYLYTSVNPPAVEAGAFIHVPALTTRNVVLRFSGVLVNRSATDGPWYYDARVTRLDAISGDRNGDVGLTPAYPRSAFVSLPNATLYANVWSTTLQQPAPYGTVLAVDPSRGFWTSAQIDGTGQAALPLYNGTFTLGLFRYNPLPVDQCIAANVTVSGLTVAQLDLPAIPESAYVWDATLDTWNTSSASLVHTQAYANQSFRIAADLYGNLDGVANATEMSWWARYPFTAPSAWPTQLPLDYLLTLSVDESPLTTTTREDTLVQGAGPYLAEAPIVARHNATFGSPVAPVDSHLHFVNVGLLYDEPGIESALTLHLPPTESSTATASPNVALHQTDASTWTIDPGLMPTPTTTFAAATIEATLAAPTDAPPVAIFTSATAERGVAVTFDGSSSTDDHGVVNYTWLVAMNGTDHFAYGVHAAFTFTEIGSYTVHLTVRDTVGQTSTVSHAVVVRDTTPPPRPTGIGAVLQPQGGGTVVNLSWNAVSADDLARYRVYRSTDGGHTFGLAFEVPADRATAVDAAASSGGTFAYRVTALDRYGNEGTPSETVQVTVPAPGGPTGTLDALVWVAIGAVAVAAVGAAAYVLLRRRRTPPAG